MEKSLLDELKELLNLIESFKKEVSGISVKREGISYATNHIDAAISESEEATKKLIDLIGSVLEELNSLLGLASKIDNEELKLNIESRVKNITKLLTSALTLLEFQDILAQRLLKVKGFLSDLEKSLLKVILTLGIEEKIGNEDELKKKMDELEWKKEVSQEDVDEIMKQFGL